MRPVAQRFYRNFADDFDVLNIVYAGPSFFQNRFHFAVQNTVQGIGVGILNNAASYGSVGRLLGISEFPLASYFDGADTAVQYEFGHQFIAFLNTPSFLGPAIIGPTRPWPAEPWGSPSEAWAARAVSSPV